MDKALFHYETDKQSSSSSALGRSLQGFWAANYQPPSEPHPIRFILSHRLRKTFLVAVPSHRPDPLHPSDSLPVRQKHVCLDEGSPT